MKENNMPLISVIMPVYNGERFLRQAVDSILNQTFHDFELIIINDGSTDSTEDIILSYTDKRIRYVKNEKNLRLIKTLNKGLGLASGQFVSRMDADDVAHPLLFEKQIEVFYRDKSVDIVNISTYELCEDGTKFRKTNKVLNYQSETLKYVEIFENQITHPGIMVKADKIKHYQYKDDGSVVNFEDVDLWIRMLCDGCKCVTLEDRLLFYRINNSSITRTVGSKRNMLRTKYLAQLLDDKFGIKVSESVLYYLYGDVQDGVCKPYEILKMIKGLEQTMRGDAYVVKQFRSWFHLRMVVVSLQIVKKYKLASKITAWSFLLTHCNYVFEKSFLNYIKMKLNNKWLPYESFNVR